MQVDFKQINAVSKEITIQVPAEVVAKAWEKHLRKTARDAEVPGFRKGKAPLAMVERMYADRMEEYFVQESVADYFDAASKEYDITYLLFPDVKDVKWERGSDMVIKIEIEHEPEIDITQTDGLTVPYEAITVESEVERNLNELVQQNGRVVDVDEAMENDSVEVEYTLTIADTQIKLNATLYAGENPVSRALPELIGKKTGDVVEAELNGTSIKLTSRKPSLELDNETMYPLSVMVNSISRVQYPTVNDDFARDMEFDSLAAMQAKMAAELSLITEHKDINAQNNAIIGKLFMDNKFDFPMKTINYLANQEAEKSPYPEYRQYIEYQYQMKVMQEMVGIYVLNNLRSKVEIEISDEMLEDYIKHEAIIADNTVEAFKENNAEEIVNDEFLISAKNYFILRKMAETANFVMPEPEAKEEIEDAVLIDQDPESPAE